MGSSCMSCSWVCAESGVNQKGRRGLRPNCATVCFLLMGLYGFIGFDVAT